MLREDRADQLVDWRIGCLPGGSAVVLEQPAVSPADECAVSSAVVGDGCNDASNDTGTPSPCAVFDPGEESGEFQAARAAGPARAREPAGRRRRAGRAL